MLAGGSHLVRPTLVTAGLLAAVLTIATPGRSESAQARSEAPQLAGTWTLDRDHSDDPRETMSAGRPSRGGFGRGGGRGGRGGGRGRPPGDRPGGPPDGAPGARGAGADSALLARVMRPAPVMEIRQDPQGLKILERDRDPRRVLIVDQKPDGKVARDVFYRDGGKFVERARLGPRRLLTEIYELSKDARTLTVVSRLEPAGGTDSGGPTVVIRRVYRKALPERAAPGGSG